MANDANSKANLEAYHKLEKWLEWPPFTASRQRRSDYRHDLLAAIDEDMERPNLFKSITDEWADEIAEAEMYSKRYPNDVLGAQKAAMKISGLTEDDDDFVRIA